MTPRIKYGTRVPESQFVKTHQGPVDAGHQFRSARTEGDDRESNNHSGDSEESAERRGLVQQKSGPKVQKY